MSTKNNTNGFDLAEFANRLKSERSRLKLTQQQFADIGGVNRATQYLYEQGERAPGVDYLSRVCEAGARLNYLIGATSSAGQFYFDEQTIRKLYFLIDEVGADSYGNLLNPGSRASLLLQALSQLKDSNYEDINWDHLKRSLMSKLATAS